MAAAALEALQAPHHLIVEAGTGTGKTLAYLIPAILSGERVIISTATKTLQDQLFYKDIPLVREKLGLEVSACVLKGRDNYLCRWRAREFAARARLEPASASALKLILQWEHETATGDRGELAELPEEVGFWPQINAKADTCLGTKCADYERCFLTSARARALASQIVVVNHHLYFADLTLREHAFGQILPDHRFVVFDEAHQLEEIAQHYFGRRVSSFRLRELAGDLERLCAAGEEARRLAGSLADALASSARGFFGRFASAPARYRLQAAAPEPPADGSAHGGTPVAPQDKGPSSGRVPAPAGGRFRDRRPQDATRSQLACDLEWAEGLLDCLQDVRSRLGCAADRTEEMQAIARRAAEIASDLEFILKGSDLAYVYWGESRSGGTFLHATRVDVSEPLAELLFNRRDGVILTSATLSIGRSFEFARHRLGVSQAAEAVIDSPFDYASQAILYAPKKMPEPRAPGHLDQLERQIRKLLEITRGRAFLLFTSYATLEAIRPRLAGSVPFPVLCQGDEAKHVLLERFRLTPNAVLLATASFWQGVDVPGEALSLVVIDKLPFGAPTDPLLEARLERLRAGGGNPFRDYQLPAAVILLKQGLGRLIRSRTDRGVLAVLDPRLRTRSYGRVFLSSLPDFRVTDRLDVIAEFFRASSGS